jgi:hypothetical protein
MDFAGSVEVTESNNVFSNIEMATGSTFTISGGNDNVITGIRGPGAYTLALGGSGGTKVSNFDVSTLTITSDDNHFSNGRIAILTAFSTSENQFVNCFIQTAASLLAGADETQISNCQFGSTLSIASTNVLMSNNDITSDLTITDDSQHISNCRIGGDILPDGANGLKIDNTSCVNFTVGSGSMTASNITGCTITGTVSYGGPQSYNDNLFTGSRVGAFVYAASGGNTRNQYDSCRIGTYSDTGSGSATDLMFSDNVFTATLAGGESLAIGTAAAFKAGSVERIQIKNCRFIAGAGDIFIRSIAAAFLRQNVMVTGCMLNTGDINLNGGGSQVRHCVVTGNQVGFPGGAGTQVISLGAANPNCVVTGNWINDAGGIGGGAFPGGVLGAASTPSGALTLLTDTGANNAGA